MPGRLPLLLVAAAAVFDVYMLVSRLAEGGLGLLAVPWRMAALGAEAAAPLFLLPHGGEGPPRVVAVGLAAAAAVLHAALALAGGVVDAVAALLLAAAAALTVFRRA